ncbi:hypothetical protein PMIN06_001991 [Paraphaeosphaeria minitans]|uniref:Ribosomal biogenesis protein GAR2 n=1 Tax=Paraphaeosphaeria minitans TaxID=565426 RepID=A0A9P6KTT2_9PLEO|nr:ribosomal biogenesis protein GAR2 [Paraphaeosphaeria minitans]
MAASDVQSKKRKGATDAQPKAKKARKSDDIAVEASAVVEAPKPKKSKKSKAVEPAETVTVEETVVVTEKPAKKAKKTKDAAPAVEAAPESDAKPAKKPKKGKKAAEAEASVTEEDIQDALAVAEEPKPKKEKKSKKSKKTDTVEEPAAEPIVEEVAAAVEEKKPKKGKKSKKEEAVVDAEETAVAESNDAEDEVLDDQTAALLAGFESDRDESDLEKEDEEFDEDALAEAGQEISKKKRKELDQARKDAAPAVVYLGRVPHGFFEPQMKKYFTQFGRVLRLRLSRNKKTGASKHFAFIEFANGEVADIVAKTMHNYLMFGHILQCRVVPSEQVHPELFKGANQRFKIDPRNQKERAALARGATRDVWEKRVQRENKRRTGKAKGLLEEFGYEFNAPSVKAVDSVPKKAAAVEDAPAQAQLTAVEADAEPKAEAAVATEEVAAKKSKKSSKDKKRKSGVPEATEEAEVPAPKSKKAKKEAQPETEVIVEKKRKISQNGTTTTTAKKTKKVNA